MTVSYDYPRPMVTVDIILFRFAETKFEILLIQRKHPPFQGQWALPGGYMGMKEKLSQAASRELLEETGLKPDFLFPLIYADHPDRDPRGRTISFIFGSILSPPFQESSAGDDAAAAGWYSLHNLPKLAFDHDEIIQRCWKKLEHELQCRFLLAAFLPQRFTRSDLNRLYQNIFPDHNKCSEWLKQVLEKGIVKEIDQNEFERVASLEVLYSKSLNI